MRQLFTIIIFIFMSLLTRGQSEKITSSELDSLYSNTIHSQYYFLSNGTIYIESNEIIERLKSIKQLDYLIFMTRDELIKESLKIKKNLNVIRVTHKLVSNDTIDINIGHLDVKAKRALHFNKGLKFIKADFKLSCCGTNGYKPTCRFVYNETANKWMRLENDE